VAQKEKILRTSLMVIALLSFSCLPRGIVARAEEGACARSGAYFSGFYPNLFATLLGKTEAEIEAKIAAAFQQLFYGRDDSERIYYPVEPDMAYILDVWHQDVRTEGMSYGMMVSVQLDKKEEFDRLWKWAKTYMQHKGGPRRGYFAWHCQTTGAVIDSNAASDGEEWFVMALFFAAARWGNGDGMYNYEAEAQAILDAMLSKADSSDRVDVVTTMFSRRHKQVVFVPVGNADDFTDPSYHVPHFYELWGRWARRENQFWCEVAETSRQFLRRAAHPVTGLFPDYALFDGSPHDPPWGGGHRDFRYDAWRVGMNVAMDYVWFGRDDWAVAQSDRLLNFFLAEGIGRYGNLYTLEGKKLSGEHSPGLVAMNGAAALAATGRQRKQFVQELWDMPVPRGPGRYYDGVLYLLAMLQVSGNFRIYDLRGKPIQECSGR
jgi:oligosaccharide reducing-end xylanase